MISEDIRSGRIIARRDDAQPMRTASGELRQMQPVFYCMEDGSPLSTLCFAPLRSDHTAFLHTEQIRDLVAILDAGFTATRAAKAHALRNAHRPVPTASLLKTISLP